MLSNQFRNKFALHEPDLERHRQPHSRRRLKRGKQTLLLTMHRSGGKNFRKNSQNILESQCYSNYI